MHPALRLFSFLLLLGPCALRASPRPPSLEAVHPRVLCLTLHQGEIRPARQIPYQAQPGDEIVERGKNRTPWVLRDGKSLGSLVGPKRDLLYPHDGFTEEPLDLAAAAKADSYAVRAGDAPVEIRAVHRKSKPVGMARAADGFRFAREHRLYLRLARPLRPGERVTVEAAAVFPGTLAYSLSDDTVSEAVHVTQIGFRPDDPVKAGFLSCWMGDGGGLDYPKEPAFHLLDERGKRVFSGKGKLSKATKDTNEATDGGNYQLTDVWQLDFSAFRAPGRYRLAVEGVGCSRLFVLARDAWSGPFVASLRALFHQRSGLALTPPPAEFPRPRDLHPEEGVVVRASKATILDTGNGPAGSGWDNFTQLVAGATEEVVPDAWGGYHDAGDFDRQTSHLMVARLLLDLFERFPEPLLALDLRIAESGDEQPDIVDEALWGIDFFARLQRPDGAVRGGIESAEHPRHGEGSWQESLPLYSYEPDAWTSYLFAASAARAARILQGPRASLAKTYAERARRAYEWAEKNPGEKAASAVRDACNLAAIELYRLTGERAFHARFVETTAFTADDVPLSRWSKHDQREAAFAYVRLPANQVEAALQGRILKAILREAKTCAEMVSRTGFRWARSNSGYALGWGRLTVPDVASVLLTHELTGEKGLLSVAVASCQPGLGANPANLVYTTGLGHTPIRHVLHYDSSVQALPPPSGLTVFGPYDLAAHKTQSGEWILKHLRTVTHPAPEKWPAIEAYYDIGAWPEMNEFVVGLLASNAATWGYLALRQETP